MSSDPPREEVLADFGGYLSRLLTIEPCRSSWALLLESSSDGMSMIQFYLVLWPGINNWNSSTMAIIDAGDSDILSDQTA